MNNFITLARRVALAAVLLGTGLAARAQTITLNGTAAAATAAQVGGGGLQYACTPYSLASPFSNEQKFDFTPGSQNEVVEKWTLLGDATPSTGYTNGQSGNSFKFAPTGFGKARLVVSYYYNNGTQPVYCPSGSTTPLLCNGVAVTTPIRAYTTKTYDFFKGFTAAQAGYQLKGPTCLPANNPSVVYSVDPAVISTKAQIQAGIGNIDDYTWTVVYTSGPSAGLNVPKVISGDQSTIIIQGTEPTKISDLTGSFSVQVKVGKCNVALPATTVTLASDLSTAGVTNFPTCLPIGSTAATSFTLNTVAGVTYTLNTTIGLLSTGGAPATSISVTGTGSSVAVNLTGITATNTGAVTIAGTATTGCFGNQTIIRQVTRQLVAAQNAISPVCVTPSSTATLTLSNAPLAAAGQTITWTLSSSPGWAITGGQGTGSITVTTGTGPVTVTAQAGTCNVGGTGIVSQTVSVNGAVAGCTFPVTPTPSACGGFTSTLTGTCLPTGNKYVQWKLEEQISPGVWTQRDLVTPVGAAQNSNSTVFYGWPTSIASPNARVTVRVMNASNCLDAPYTYLGAFTTCGPKLFPQPGGGISSAQPRERLQVYPNPTSGQLSIDLEANLGQGAATVSLVDALGRVHQTTTTDQARLSLDVRRLPEGVYTLRVALPSGKTLTQPVQVRH